MNKRLWVGISATAVALTATGIGAYVVSKSQWPAQANAGEKAPSPGTEPKANETTKPPAPEPPDGVIPVPVNDFAQLDRTAASPAQFESPSPAPDYLGGNGGPGGEEMPAGPGIPPAPFHASGEGGSGGSFVAISPATGDDRDSFPAATNNGDFAIAAADDFPAPAEREPAVEPPASNTTDGGATASIGDFSPPANAIGGDAPTLLDLTVPPQEPEPPASDNPPMQPSAPSLAPGPEIPQDNGGVPAKDAAGFLFGGAANQNSNSLPAADERPFDQGGLRARDAGIPPIDKAGPNAPFQPDTNFAPHIATDVPPILDRPQSSGTPMGAQPAMQPSEAPQVGIGGLAAIVSDVPGPERLEGPQVPTLSLEKIAPPEIQVGKAAAFELIVRNSGDVTAHDVTVMDRVPRGTKLVAATPDYQQAADGTIIWQLGSLKPNDETTIAMELMPQVEGEIGSVAHVIMQSQASVRTLCTKPELVIEHSSNDKVLIGNDVIFDITISNPGTGEATGVILEEDVPQGLTHPMGRKLDNPLGNLQPNESRRLELVLTAAEPGRVANVIRVRGEGGLFSEHRVELDVIAPQLDIVLSGPSVRYLERQVKYQISVANPGTAPATNVDLVVEMPSGLQFVSADQDGQYDDRSHSVYWSLAELPPQQQGVVQLTALPIEVGQQTLLVKGKADLDLDHQIQHTTQVEAITEVEFSVSDVQDPIEVGSETTYDVRVVNNGSKVATNIQLAGVVSRGVTPLAGEGPTRVQIDGQQIVMDPIPELDPGEEVTYRLRVQGETNGDHILRVQLISDEAPNPVTKEEGTRVYADE